MKNNQLNSIRHTTYSILLILDMVINYSALVHLKTIFVYIIHCSFFKICTYSSAIIAIFLTILYYNYTICFEPYI